MLENINFTALPVLAFLLCVIIASLLSSLVLWKKLVYFGDAISHSSMLAVVFASMIGAEINFVLPIFGLVFAVFVWFLQSGKIGLGNTANAVSAYFCISLALIFGSEKASEIDFASLLFGDLLSANFAQILSLLVLLSLVIGFLVLNFKKFVLMIVSKDLAKIEGINVSAIELIFLILIALASALLAKMVGILLASSLLAFPGLIARNLAKSPLQMLVFSLLIGVLIGSISLLIAAKFALSISALMILMLCLTFFFCAIFKNKFND